MYVTKIAPAYRRLLTGFSRLSRGISPLRLPERKPSRSRVTNLNPKARKAGTIALRTSGCTSRGRSSSGNLNPRQITLMVAHAE